MFFYEFCKIFKNSFFTENLWATVSEYTLMQLWHNPSHRLFKDFYDEWVLQKQSPEVFCKKVFSKILQNLPQINCTRASAYNFIKKEWHGGFLWIWRNFYFYRTPPGDCLWFFKFHTVFNKLPKFQVKIVNTKHPENPS